MRDRLKQKSISIVQNPVSSAAVNHKLWPEVFNTKYYFDYSIIHILIMTSPFFFSSFLDVVIYSIINFRLEFFIIIRIICLKSLVMFFNYNCETLLLFFRKTVDIRMQKE